MPEAGRPRRERTPRVRRSPESRNRNPGSAVSPSTLRTWSTPPRGGSSERHRWDTLVSPSTLSPVLSKDLSITGSPRGVVLPGDDLATARRLWTQLVECPALRASMRRLAIPGPGSVLPVWPVPTDRSQIARAMSTRRMPGCQRRSPPHRKRSASSSGSLEPRQGVPSAYELSKWTNSAGNPTSVPPTE